MMVANYEASNKRGAGGGMRRSVLCPHELGKRLAVALPAVGEKSPARKGKLYSSALVKERLRVARKAETASRPVSSGTKKKQPAGSSTSKMYSQQVVKEAKRVLKQNRSTRIEPTREELAAAQEAVHANREKRKRNVVNYVESEVEEESEGDESSEDEDAAEGSSEGEDGDDSDEDVDDSDLD